MDTTAIAKKLIDSEFWKEKDFDFKTLCRIRDCLLILKSIDPIFCDESLLAEINKYILQKAENNLVA